VKYDYACSESILIAEDEIDKGILMELWNSIENKNSKIDFDEESGIMCLWSD